jgi:hypothetical protein
MGRVMKMGRVRLAVLMTRLDFEKSTRMCRADAILCPSETVVIV